LKDDEMIYVENLEELIFNRHKMFDVDQLIIISGFIGQSPVKKLDTLPLSVTVLYGMYPIEGVRKKLHEALVSQSNTSQNTDIRYSTYPVHSKIYAWLSNGKVVHALIGSANFTNEGLLVPFKEILTEATFDIFRSLENYIRMIVENSIDCRMGVANTES
jgi:hypothetical protein